MTAPSDAVGNASQARTRQLDDFVIVTVVKGRRATAFAVTGPGLAPEGIPFVTLAEAVSRGTVIAQNSHVALWDATTPGAAVLVVNFRR